MNNPEPSIYVTVDPMNPGQFFACCGLLELADRLWKVAEGWFEGGQFCIACEGTLTALLDHLLSVPLEPVDVSDIYSSPYVWEIHLISRSTGGRTIARAERA